MARILVADDDAEILTVVGDLLSLHGHEVTLACDGAEAVEKLKKAPYDLLVIDRAMPRLDGLQAIRILRSAPAFKALRIVMLTSANVTKEIDEAFAAGADGYVLKPLNIGAFLARVAKALAPRG